MDRLTKEFSLSGFWGSWRLARVGGWPRLVHARQILRAVDGVSLTIRAGETFGLVGESGCGKSTIGHMLVGLIPPTAGEARLAGRRLDTAAPAERLQHRKDVQIIFQDPDSSLNPRKTVGQIVARPLELFGLAAGPRGGERVAELLETVQLSPAFVSRYPHQLSGGEKQRVGIARALAAEPRFIVCDEPISALDVSVRASILNLLGELKARLGLAYLFIAHDLGVVRHISDRVAVMYRGRLCETGAVDEVFSPPHHPYTWALLSAIPNLDASVRAKRVRLRGQVTGSPTVAGGCVFCDRCPFRIGPICDEVAPPLLEPSPGHTIACHHPLPVLRDLENIRF